MSVKTHAIEIDENGGPEVLVYRAREIAEPGPGEVRIRQTAIGLNYIDVYHRTGLYPAPAFPLVPGMEGAGVVEAVGAGVGELKAGERVAYAGSLGGYAEHRNIAADRLVKLPDAIDDRTAAAMMLQGMTAQYLLFRSFKVGPGTTLLIHAAAGGVGLIVCQWARHVGATVIGTVGSAEKAALARAHGCTHTINYREEDFVARVKEITGGGLCDVVYDSIGKDTFPASLDCLKPLGMFVSFGQSSGAIPPVNLAIFAQKGSLFMTRPTLMTYTAKRADLVASAEALFKVVAGGEVKIEVNQTYPLSRAADAHRDLEARKTTGSTVLLPG
ncbi:MAG: quinone oxidoreductase [Hyphomicrobiaceae bacterium]